MKETNTENRYEFDSVESMIFHYFSTMDVYLNAEQVEDVVEEIALNNGKFFSTLDGLQEKYGALADNYMKKK